MFSKFPDDSLVQSGLRSTVLEDRTNLGVNLRLEGRGVTGTVQLMGGPTHWGLALEFPWHWWWWLTGLGILPACGGWSAETSLVLRGQFASGCEFSLTYWGQHQKRTARLLENLVGGARGRDRNPQLGQEWGWALACEKKIKMRFILLQELSCDVQGSAVWNLTFWPDHANICQKLRVHIRRYSKITPVGLFIEPLPKSKLWFLKDKYFLTFVRVDHNSYQTTGN